MEQLNEIEPIPADVAGFISEWYNHLEALKNYPRHLLEALHLHPVPNPRNSGKRLRIWCVGTPGSGKSSFFISIAATLKLTGKTEPIDCFDIPWHLRAVRPATKDKVKGDADVSVSINVEATQFQLSNGTEVELMDSQGLNLYDPEKDAKVLRDLYFGYFKQNIQALDADGQPGTLRLYSDVPPDESHLVALIIPQPPTVEDKEVQDNYQKELDAYAAFATKLTNWGIPHIVIGTKADLNGDLSVVANAVSSLDYAPVSNYTRDFQCTVRKDVQNPETFKGIVYALACMIRACATARPVKPIPLPIQLKNKAFNYFRLVFFPLSVLILILSAFIGIFNVL